jgi:hypothetical protein
VILNQRFGTTYRSYLQRSSCPPRSLNMGPIYRPETSVSEYSTPRNNPEDRRIQFNHGGSLLPLLESIPRNGILQSSGVITLIHCFCYYLFDVTDCSGNAYLLSPLSFIFFNLWTKMAAVQRRFFQILPQCPSVYCFQYKLFTMVIKTCLFAFYPEIIIFTNEVTLRNIQYTIPFAVPSVVMWP